MKRIHFLAAELFSYSYDNYRNHLGIGNVRFDKLMPEGAALLERAEKEGWSDEQIAAESDFKLEQVPYWREKIREALAVVDAESPAQLFLRGVRASVEHALSEGLDDEKSVNNLVGQICYRAADLSCVLKQEDEPLWKYSAELRSRADDISDLDHDFNFDE
ncbi:hypothetical protein [Halalkalibaculum sp. DA384]|uniref:hypothetical protein n=1 Tax=Halalkalibaculum sp. DA384 TaxID=3373606 RepID=UPI0037549EDD